jgi:hypothetical protein
MKIFFFFARFIFLGLLITSCSRSIDNRTTADTLTFNHADSNKIADQDIFKLESYLTKEEGDTATMQTINFDGAILIYPSDSEMDDMQQKYGEDDFLIIADDSQFYQSEAINNLDSLQIKNISTPKQKLKFIGKNQTWVLDVKKKGLPEWNLILFNTRTTPQVIAPIDATIEKLQGYFKK